ncbi:MAG: nuclear transport factor 2 family protein [Saprospiraceae bacterium]
MYKYTSLLSLLLLVAIGCTRKLHTPIADTQAINQLMDKWHHAAAVADEDTFFGSMAADAIYLGTDASERWTLNEMREWSKPYFAKESAWVLKPFSRNVYFSKDGQYAWFEEKIATDHMGECRGSGVLRRIASGWQIMHYNLAIAVPNALVKDLLLLQKKK